MSAIDLRDADAKLTSFNVYEKSGAFRENYPTLNEAKAVCNKGDTVVERHQYTYCEDGETVHTQTRAKRAESRNQKAAARAGS